MGWVELAFVALVFGIMFLGRRGSAPKGPPPAGGAEEGARRPEVLTLGSMLAAWQEAVNAAQQQAAAHEPDMPDEPGALTASARVLPPVSSAPRNKPTKLPAVADAPVAIMKRAPAEVVTVDRDAEHARFHERVAAAPPRAPSARPRIRNAGDLRRAVLLSEVLGPPRAMREINTP